MSASYILVEGINIGANIYDTNQLSIVRGGSFLLKQAIVDIAGEFENDLEVISAGASSGLFRLKSGSVGIPGKVAEFLADHQHYSLLTFGVESCEAEDLQAAKEQLLAQLRIHQLQGATLVPDCLQGDSAGPSDWSGVRAKDQSPETVTYYSDGVQDNVEISSSEKRRWQYGREQKQSYYLKETVLLREESSPGNDLDSLIAELDKYYFTRDLGELSTSDKYPDLSGKIAVFYADGNSFGKLQQDLLNEAKPEERLQTQKDFDTQLQRKRREFLARAMREMLDERFPEMKTTTRIDTTDGLPALRFETLLWGGDEMLFVMPAWIGFDFLQFFFEQTRDWKIKGRRLTHSVGLVFCSAKTPIRITRQLAQVIADHIKLRTSQESQGKRNAWDYMVLESIDYPTRMDFDHFLSQRYDLMAQSRPSCIEPGSNWSGQGGEIQRVVRDALPVRQLYRLAHYLIREDAFTAGSQSSAWPPNAEPFLMMEQMERRLLDMSEDSDAVEQLLLRLGTLFGLKPDQLQQRAWIWLHLLELRDYLAPGRKA